MTDFAILLGGRLVVTDRLSRQLKGARFIAADGGMVHAEGLGILPEAWVGDFDSTPADLMARYPDIRRETYPAEKALTDGELAVETALEAGASRLILVGAMGGGRADHSMAHLIQALALAERGVPVFLTSGDEEAHPLLPGDMTLDLPAGSLFSILGFTDLEGLSIENARYPLDRFSLPFGSSRTLSNVAEGEIRLRLGSGRAMVLARPYDFTGV
jgi:thiamine pyrophosphokinase